MAVRNHVALLVALVALFAVTVQGARELNTVKTSAKLPAGVTPADLVSKLTAFKSAADDLTSTLPVNTGILATVLNLESGIVGQVLSLLGSVSGGLGDLSSLDPATTVGALPLDLDLGAVTGGLPGGLPLDASSLDLGSLTSVGGLTGLVSSLTSKVRPGNLDAGVPFVGNIGGGLPGIGGLGAVPLVGPLLGGLVAGLLGGGLPLLG